MFEKNEWWIILAALALGTWYFFKKFGATMQTAIPGVLTPHTGASGSLVNPTHEVATAFPAQTTTPVLFRPAQPAAGSQMIRVGTYSTVPVSQVPATRLVPTNWWSA
jgi:hypothetical protein